ncbi:MAG: PAS domain S-box protein [Bacteroidota bacterium]
MEVVHVLLLEDHEGEARLNQRLLERSYSTEFQFESFRFLKDAIEVVKQRKFDVVLLDLNVLDSKGLDTFLALQAAAPQLPVVIVSAVADDRVAQTAIHQGAQDYLVKGSITSEILTRVVLFAIARKQALSDEGRIIFQPAFEALPLCAAFALDEEGNITHAASQLAQLFELPDPHASLYRPLVSFVAEEDRPRLLDSLKRVRRNESAESLLVHTASSRQPAARVLVSLSRAAVASGAGKIQGTVVPAPPGMDTSSEGAQLEARYRTLVEHSQDGVFVVSNGKIISANRAFCELLGFHIDEVYGKGVADLIAPEDYPFVLDNYQRRIAGEEVEEVYECMALHSNGSRLRVQLSVGRISLGDGFGVMGTLKDVTERYRLSYLARLQQRLAIDLAHAKDREEIYEYVLQSVLRIERIDVAAIYIQDIKTGHFQQSAWRGLRGPFPAAEAQAAFDQMHDRLVRETASLFLNEKELSTDRFGSLLLPSGIRAFGLVPVMHGGMSIAAIDVGTLTAESFDEPIQHTLESIASFLGGVLARVLAEESRMESEILYRAVVEKSHDAIIIYCESGLVFANQRASDITGYAREEMTAMNPWAIVHPEDRARVQSFAASRSTGNTEPIVYEARILAKDGTIRIGEFAGTVIRYGGVPASLVTVRDLTSRKTQEEELKRSDALIRAAGFAATKFLRAADWEDSIMEVLERFGSASNVCRVVIFENVDEEHASRVMRQRAVWVRPEMRDSMIERVPDGHSFDDEPFHRWAAELSAGNPVSGIIDNLPNEEQVFLARQNVRSLAVLPVFCGDKWWGIIRFDECRVRRTWLRSELEAMGVSAETLGAAIRRKQAEQELVTSREVALQADAIKKSFIANISHEVRTPVNIVLGYLALVAEMIAADVGEEINEYVEAINDASLRLVRTVDSVLNISRFQTGDISIASEPLRLDKLLWDCGERFRRQAEEKGLILTFHNECERIEILGDQHFLVESIEHLIDNAIKFTAKGEISLDLSLGSDQEPVIHIKDTGIGVSEEFLEKVFEPYLQEDIGYDRMYEGIGLGLTLVKLYLEAHGATIHIESIKGDGTLIEVVFPSTIKINSAPAVEF